MNPNEAVLDVPRLIRERDDLLAALREIVSLGAQRRMFAMYCAALAAIAKVEAPKLSLTEGKT